MSASVRTIALDEASKSVEHATTRLEAARAWLAETQEEIQHAEAEVGTFTDLLAAAVLTLETLQRAETP